MWFGWGGTARGPGATGARGRRAAIGGQGSCAGSAPPLATEGAPRLSTGRCRDARATLAGIERGTKRRNRALSCPHSWLERRRSIRSMWATEPKLCR
jgi:hypothetical protein